MADLPPIQVSATSVASLHSRIDYIVVILLTRAQLIRVVVTPASPGDPIDDELGEILFVDRQDLVTALLERLSRLPLG